jgi:hypothetical protein
VRERRAAHRQTKKHPFNASHTYMYIKIKVNQRSKTSQQKEQMKTCRVEPKGIIVLHMYQGRLGKLGAKIKTI